MTQSRPEPKVIVIPAKEESPQDQEKKKNLRVAAYCRVSTKKDEQLGSYENQKAYYTEKIMANPNWTMADIFADEGITGTSACKRKDFLRMIRQCRKGKIDMILNTPNSRGSRSDGYSIRAAAIAADLPQFTTITEFQAALLAIEAVKHNDYQIMSIQEHSKQLFELERREF